MKKFALPLVPAVLAMFFSAGCSGASPELLTVDVTENYPRLEQAVQELADVEYIPLETNDDFLLSGAPRLFYADNEYLMLSDQQKIFIYDRSGRAINMISRRGRGPQEYGSLGPTAYDPYAGEILVYERLQDRVLFYSPEGRFIRQLEMSQEENYYTLKVWDSDNLIVYNSVNARTPEESRLKTASIISGQDGSTLEEITGIRFEKRYVQMMINFSDGTAAPMNIDQGIPSGFFGVTVYSVEPIQRSGKEFLLSEISADTIFRLSHDMKLTPVAMRTPSVADTDGMILLAANHETPRYLFMSVIDMRRDYDDANQNLIYDKRGEKIHTLALYNDDYTARPNFDLGPRSFDADITPAGSAYAVIDTFELVRANARGEVRGRLKEIADRLQEDGNPVLMIATFKE